MTAFPEAFHSRHFLIRVAVPATRLVTAGTLYLRGFSQSSQTTPPPP